MNNMKVTFGFFVCVYLWEREIMFEVVGFVSTPCGVTSIQGDKAGNASGLLRFLHVLNSQYISGFWDLPLFIKSACISCISACHLRCFFPRNLCSRSSDCFRSIWTRRKTWQSIKNQFFCSGIINQMHKQSQHWHLAGLMFKTCGNYSSPENRLASKSHKSLWLWRKWELAEKN